MKNTIIIILNLLLLISCNNKELDLSQVDFNQDARRYNLDDLKVYKKEGQKGHYEVKHDGDDISLITVDNGEKVINYVFMENSVSQVNFAGLNIDSLLGAKVVDYNGKIAFISANVNSKQTSELISYFIKTFGVPTEVINNERHEEAVNLGASQILFKSLPNYTKKQKDEFYNNSIIYPQNIIWVKKDIIYQLTLEPSNNMVNNVVKIISKHALRDKIIIGFHNPEKDPILSKYLN
jgi:hypothetical protein